MALYATRVIVSSYPRASRETHVILLQYSNVVKPALSLSLSLFVSAICTPHCAVEFHYYFSLFEVNVPFKATTTKRLLFFYALDTAQIKNECKCQRDKYRNPCRFINVQR